MTAHPLQMEPYETPMQPITMMRNALGREEGGSGVPVDRDAYAKWVASEAEVLLAALERAALHA